MTTPAMFIAAYLIVGAAIAYFVDRLTDRRRGWTVDRACLICVITVCWLPGLLALGIAMLVSR